MISVIVPVYNVGKYLVRCVDSILAQTFTDLEIILVDDGSTDNSGVLCDAYTARDKRIRVVHKTNGGAGSARNMGLQMARGEYIGFIDGDDYIDIDMYEYLYNNIVKEKADVAMCELYHCYQGKSIEKHPCTYYKVTDAVGAIHCVLESKITSVTPVNKLYRRSLFSQLRFREGVTAEDAFLMVDLLEKCERVVISNEQKYYYYHRADSVTSKPLNERDYDVIEAYEYNFKRALEISPDLFDVALLRQCWARFYMLDKMMLCDSEYDHVREKEYVEFLRKQSRFILKNDVFTKGRRISFLALLINIKLYKRIVRYKVRKDKAVNE